MNWADYSRAFRAEARAKRRSERYVSACLRYGRRLHRAGLPVIYSSEHLSGLVGYDPHYVGLCSFAQERAYRRFLIPKRSGGEREIAEPLPSLKEIQYWILQQILYTQPVSRFAKGFVPGRNIAENARFHQKQPVVLSLDIRDYFPSFSRRAVHVLFRSWGYSPSVSATLSYLCTLNGCLPQGAPTSPALSNLLFAPADGRIGAFALKSGCRYTRYADDLTISGQVAVGRTIRAIRAIVGEYGLVLNDKKTRVMRPSRRQEVTGVVVNERARAPIEVRREVRRVLHYIRRFGLGSHLEYIGETRTRYVQHMLGRVSFVLHFEPEHSDAGELRRLLMDFLEGE